MSSEHHKISPEEFNTIERYLLNTMTEPELIAFEKELKVNQVLNEQVDEYRLLFQSIEAEALKEKLNVFHEESGFNVQSDLNSETTKALPWYKHYSIAASIVVLLGLFGVWYILSPNSNEVLYAKYFKPDPGLPTVMSNGNSNFAFYDAMVNYKQGDYEKAIDKWKTLLENNPQNDTLNYFLGVSHLANEQIDLALPYLEKTTTSKASSFKNDAYYYLGLIHLKTGNVELAKKNLNFSTIDNSTRLLQELDK